MRAAVAAALGGVLLAGSAAAQEAPRELYRKLNDLRVDSRQVYSVHELQLRRDAISLTFSEGSLAFLQALDGRRTGAVFTGSGRVIAIPRERVERGSLGRFLGAPLLDQPFTRAYLRFTDDTGELLARQLGASGAQPSEQPDVAADWDSALADLNPGHSLRIMQDWLSASPHPYFYAGLVGEEFGPFDVLVDTRRSEQVVIGQTKWVEGTAYHDVWASFSTADGAAAPPEPFVPVDYSIETTIQPDRTLEGKASVRLRAAGGERMVALELSHLLGVSAVTDGDSREVPFFQNEESSRREALQRGNDLLLAVLPEAPAAGQEVRLHFVYRGSVISDAGNGVYFVGARGSWYPHISGTDRFARFDLIFHWPRKLQLVATGRLVEQGEEGEWRRGHWSTPDPITVAGFNLGDYITEKVDSGGTVIQLYANRQFEQAIQERFNRRSETPGGSTRLDPWPLYRLGAPPLMAAPAPTSPGAVLKRLGQNLGDSLRYYEKGLGPFPFDRLAVSQIPGSFGQGWPGLLYLSTLVFLPPESAERAAIGSTARREFDELVPYHEVAHQWWGNVVGWSSYRDQWINEALANYLAMLYSDSRRPAEHVLSNWLERYRTALTTAPSESGLSPDEAGPLVLGYRLHSSKTPGAYSAVVYGKGAWVLQMLRQMLREPSGDDKDPDARFWGLLRGLLEQYRFRSLTTEDFQSAVERQMTPAMDLEGSHSMAWFFDEWVRGTGIPRYSVEFQARPRGTGFRVRGKLKQSGVPESFLARVPLFGVTAAGKTLYLGSVVASGAETSFDFSTRMRPTRLVIDPQLTLLCRAEPGRRTTN